MRAGAAPMAGKSSGSLPAKRECSVPGKHAWVLWNTQFEIDERYVPIKAIGKGAYGVVCSAKDALSGDKVAIKKITNAFDNLTDARRTLREMKLLRHLKHENIIALRDIPRPPTRDFNDVYLVGAQLCVCTARLRSTGQALLPPAVSKLRHARRAPLRVSTARGACSGRLVHSLVAPLCARALHLRSG